MRTPGHPINGIDDGCRLIADVKAGTAQPPITIGDLVGKFTGLERRLFNFLRSKEGEIISVDSIMDGLYSANDDAPQPKIVDVVICRVRKKLRGSAFIVETHSGKGRKLVRQEKCA